MNPLKGNITYLKRYRYNDDNYLPFQTNTGCTTNGTLVLMVLSRYCGTFTVTVYHAF